MGKALKIITEFIFECKKIAFKKYICIITLTFYHHHYYYIIINV